MPKKNTWNHNDITNNWQLLNYRTNMNSIKWELPLPKESSNNMFEKRDNESNMEPASINNLWTNNPKADFGQRTSGNQTSSTTGSNKWLWAFCPGQPPATGARWLPGLKWKMEFRNEPRDVGIRHANGPLAHFFVDLIIWLYMHGKSNITQGKLNCAIVLWRIHSNKNKSHTIFTTTWTRRAATRSGGRYATCTVRCFLFLSHV